MTHDQNLAAIRAACIAANPEIAELKFGCELAAKGKKLLYVGKNNGQHAILIADRQELLFVDKLGESCEVIGREITLPDVLLALEEKYGGKYAIDARGEFLVWGSYYATGQRWQHLEVIWNLREGLLGQSEETVDYIANLLR